MLFQICACLLISAALAHPAEDKKKAAALAEKKQGKRGLLGLGYGLDGGYGGYASSGLGYSLSGLGSGAVLGDGYGYGATGLAAGAAIDLGATANTHTTITKTVGVPVPAPYPVTVERHVRNFAITDHKPLDI